MPHLCIVERNNPTPVRRRISLTQQDLGRIIPGGEGPGDGINVWRREVLSAAGTKGYLDLSSRCCVVGVNRSRSWKTCFGSIARRARDSVALFWRSSMGIIPVRTKGLSIGVGRRYLVINRKASNMCLSTRRVCLLRHQTGVQYSAAEWIKARVAVRNLLASEPHLEPANRLKSPTQAVSFLLNDSSC